jgi:hypothetical protein
MNTSRPVERTQRMKKPAVILVMMVMAAVPAAAQKVFVDYDTQAIYNEYHTFAWATTAPTSLEANFPLAHSLIKNSIEWQMTQGDMVQVEEDQNPDLLVTYHAVSQDEQQILTTGFGYSFGPYWGGAGAASAMTNYYNKGTLVIDIWDAKERQAIFRGTASRVFSEDPNKVLKQIDTSIQKIADKFRKMRSKQMK